MAPNDIRDRLRRLGHPGPIDVFGYIVAIHSGVQCIVYAQTMKKALDIFIRHERKEPYSIRQMADGE